MLFGVFFGGFAELCLEAVRTPLWDPTLQIHLLPKLPAHGIIEMLSVFVFCFAELRVETVRKPLLPRQEVLHRGARPQAVSMRTTRSQPIRIKLTSTNPEGGVSRWRYNASFLSGFPSQSKFFLLYSLWSNQILWYKAQLGNSKESQPLLNVLLPFLGIQQGVEIKNSGLLMVYCCIKKETPPLGGRKVIGEAPRREALENRRPSYIATKLLSSSYL